MKNLRRVLALIGVALILLMYILTMVFAFRKDPNAKGLFFGSLAMTIIVPVFLYALQIAAKMVKPGKSPVIDAVIFDLGRVLVDFPWEEHAESLDLSPEGLAFVKSTIYDSDLWRELDRGTKTREQVIAAFTAMNPALEPDIRKYINTIYDCLNPFPYTEGWTAALRQHGYEVYLLTNWPIGAKEEMRERGALNFEKYVNGGIWSCEAHLLKPEKEIFEMLTRTYSLKPSRCVFIDDNEENVQVAKDLGFASFRFENYPDAVKKLADLGVKC